MKLTVNTFTTLDGVMQGPGGPDEDRTGGFERGGWLMPLADADFGRIVDSWFAQTDALLIGRTTYDLFRAYWPQVTDPADHTAAALNTAPKYVVSTTLTDPSWGNSTVVGGDTDSVVSRVRELKAQAGRELQVHGSHGLIQTLHDAGLVDEYRIIVAPVVVGSGKRLFEGGCVPIGFDLVETDRTAAGCQYMVLRPGGPLEVATATIEDGQDVVR